MSTITMETDKIAAAQAIIATSPAEPANAIKLVKPIPVATDLEEVTFLDDHPLVPVVVIGAISLVLAVTAIASIVMLLAIRYSGVMAP